MILYRPVGLSELRLIFEGGMKAFPPRLPEQPIFYPVLNREYARQIALEWNTKREPFAGYVTTFDVDDAYFAQFERHVVGGRQHEELWVPAEQLDEFNDHIVGSIGMLAAYFGEEFLGDIPAQFGMQNKDAVAQFVMLSRAREHFAMDFYLEIVANQKAVFLNYPFWVQWDFADAGVDASEREETLHAIRAAWEQSSIPTPLWPILEPGAG